MIFHERCGRKRGSNPVDGAQEGRFCHSLSAIEQSKGQPHHVGHTWGHSYGFTGSTQPLDLRSLRPRLSLKCGKMVR